MMQRGSGTAQDPARHRPGYRLADARASAEQKRLHMDDERHGAPVKVFFVLARKSNRTALIFVAATARVARLARTFHESAIGMTNAGADQVAVLDTLLVNASSDARMGTFYQTYYCQMKTAGSGLANNFNDIFDWGKFGQWGLSRTVCGNNCSPPSQSAYLKYTVRSLLRGHRRHRGPRNPAIEWCNDAISDCDRCAVSDRPRVVHGAIMGARRVGLVSGQ
jgi:hypothetical protein